MDQKIAEALVKQLDGVITRCHKLRTGGPHGDFSGVSNLEASLFTTIARAAIERIGGKNSVYTRQVEAVYDVSGVHDPYTIPLLGGIAEALKADLVAGYLQTVQELIHAELFADFLEMADHLLSEGYKDAAAVIAGSTLEGHLRQVCQKHGVDIEVKTAKGGVVPKRADRLNADLAKEDVYSKLDQKNVTAWLDLRNNAAHGKYDAYTKEQVGFMASGIRDFITRIPA